MLAVGNLHSSGSNVRVRPVSTKALPASKLEVEALETRNLLSNATFAVATGILNSPENFTDFIANEYRHLLGRWPDTNGFNHFLGLLANGIIPETVEAQLTSSPQYTSHHLTTPSS